MKNFNMRRKIILILFSVAILTFLQCNADEYPYYMEETFSYGNLTDIGFSVIIDVSGSMSSDMPTIKAELYSLVNAMTSEDYMQFLITGSTPTIQVSWQNDTDLIKNSIDNLYGSGTAERYDLAISKAVNNSYPGKLNVILLFGDGQIYSSGEPERDVVIAAVKRATNNGRAVIYTFGTTGANDYNLNEIATEGRGEYYNNLSASDPKLGDIYDDIKKQAQAWINTDE